jgi:3-hydroxyacyl-[acyl-carrier-protein] dehydratase
MSERFFHERLMLQGKMEQVAAAARFPADSDWFSGHFPGNPILPGVALIALVEEAVVEWERRKGRSVAITGVHRVRFRLFIKPDDELALEAVPTSHPKGPAYAFAVRHAGETACSGVLTAEIVSS